MFSHLGKRLKNRSNFKVKKELIGNSYNYVFHVLETKDKKYTVTYLITSALLPIFALIILLLTKQVVDKIQAYNFQGDTEQIMSIVILFAIVMSFDSVIGSTNAFTLTRLIQYSVLEQEKIILLKNNRLYQEDLDNPKIKNVRESAKRFNYIDVFRNFIDLIKSIFMTIMLVGILIYYKCFVVILLVFILFYINNKLMTNVWINRDKLNKSQVEPNRKAKYIFDMLLNRDNTMEIRVYSMFEHLKNEMKEIIVKNQNATLRLFGKTECYSTSTNILTAILSGSIVLLITLTNNTYIRTAGVYVIIIQIVGQLLNYINIMIGSYGQAKAYGAQYEDLCEFLNLREIKSETIYMDMNKKGTSIELKEVSFQYDIDQDYVLKDINFAIKSGEKIAIVGKNGAGKSTLVKLLIGSYEPTKGNISWKIDEKEVRISSIKNGIRIVFQDFVKILTNIRENIALGDIDKLQSDNEIKEVIRKVKIFNHHEIDLDAQVGPEFGGIDFSGGQWQKIGLARAYLTEGLFVVFDEPTASLDSRAEYNIAKSFVNLSKDKTAVLVTHRLYMTKFVDKIFVMDEGQIKEVGSHEELIEAKGYYYRMFHSQAKFYE